MIQRCQFINVVMTEAVEHADFKARRLAQGLDGASQCPAAFKVAAPKQLVMTKRSAELASAKGQR